MLSQYHSPQRRQKVDIQSQDLITIETHGRTVHFKSMSKQHWWGSISVCQIHVFGQYDADY